jgi:hypothetical protein
MHMPIYSQETTQPSATPTPDPAVSGSSSDQAVPMPMDSTIVESPAAETTTMDSSMMMSPQIMSGDGCDVCGTSMDPFGYPVESYGMDPFGSGFDSCCDPCGDMCPMDFGGMECGGFAPPFAAPYPMAPMYPAPMPMPFDVYQDPCQDVCGCQMMCPCGPVRRWWLEGAALIWWTTPSDSPVLASTSDPGVAQMDAGVMGLATTEALMGGGDVLDGTRGGFRMRAGHWFDDCGTFGIDGEYFMLGKTTDTFHMDSTGDPIIARPFDNALTGLPDSQLIAYPGLNSGSLNIGIESRLQSGALHLRRTLIQTCRAGDPCTGRGMKNFTLGIQGGSRIIGLRDSLTLSEQTVSAETGTQFDINDGFRTRNRFWGYELGIFASSQRRRFSLDGGVRLALGRMKSELDVDGQTMITEADGNVTTLPGGLLAQRTNMGSWEKSRLEFVPQLDVSLGYKLTDTWKFSVGYNLLFLNNVLRATEQVDPVLNPNLLPPEADPFDGPLRPGHIWRESEYLAHGISLGLEKRW